MNSKLSQFQNKSRKFFQLFHVLLQSRPQPIFIHSETLQKLCKNIFILQRCFFQLLLQARNETNWSTTGANDGKDHVKPTPAVMKTPISLSNPCYSNYSPSPALPSEWDYCCPQYTHTRSVPQTRHHSLFINNLFLHSSITLFHLLIKDKIFQMYKPCRQLNTYLTDLRKSNVK